jgi:hypothetical protein
VISGYGATMKQPLDPFVVARNRPSAFRWCSKDAHESDARRIAINVARQPELHGNADSD